MKDINACLEQLAGQSTTCKISERGSFFEKTVKHGGQQVAKIAAPYGEEFSSCYPQMGSEPFKVILFHQILLQTFYGFVTSKVIVTKQGCTITIVSKSPSFTIKTSMKKTNNFLIWVQVYTN